MAEITLLEFIVYGLVGYTGIILLVASAFKDIPDTKSQSVIRSIWVLAPIFCMYMLANAGNPIWVNDGYTESVLTYNGTGDLITNSTNTVSGQSITLLQPVWVTLHLLFFFMLIIYFIWNMLQLLTKRY